MKNTEVAALFNAIADFLEIKGDNPFRVRAYRRAAQTVEGLTEDVAAIADHLGFERFGVEGGSGGGPPVQLASTLRNCQGSLSSISSANWVQRFDSGVQSV